MLLVQNGAIGKQAVFERPIGTFCIKEGACMSQVLCITMPDAHALKLISAPEETREDFIEYVVKKVEAIIAAAENGDSCIEISVKPEYAYSMGDILTSCGFEVRHPKRGKLFVSWVFSWSRTP